MIDYTEAEVNVLNSMIDNTTENVYPAIHIVRELRRKFYYKWDHPPYIIPDTSGSTDSAYFVQQVPFEKLPLHVNNSKTKLLLQWRLRIRK